MPLPAGHGTSGALADVEARGRAPCRSRQLEQHRVDDHARGHFTATRYESPVVSPGRCHPHDHNRQRVADATRTTPRASRMTRWTWTAPEEAAMGRRTSEARCAGVDVYGLDRDGNGTGCET